MSPSCIYIVQRTGDVGGAAGCLTKFELCLNNFVKEALKHKGAGHLALSF